MSGGTGVSPVLPEKKSVPAGLPRCRPTTEVTAAGTGENLAHPLPGGKRSRPQSGEICQSLPGSPPSAAVLAYSVDKLADVLRPPAHVPAAEAQGRGQLARCQPAPHGPTRYS